jgi:DNA-binding IclR family transcriptional regulator
MTNKRLQVAWKSVHVIEHLYENNSGTASEIAEALDMPVSTAYAYLSTLEDLGLVDKSSGEYILGLNLLRFGVKSRTTNELYNHVEPYLPQIAQETGDCVRFGVERMGYRILVDIIEGTQAVHDNPNVGEWRPLHLTSLGKAIMAQYEWDYIESFIEEEYGMEQHTNNSITSKEEVQEEWQWTRSRGFAIDDEEYSSYIRAIAVPIDTPSIDEVGAIAISGPKQRLSEDRLANYVELLDKYAELIKVDIEHN